MAALLAHVMLTMSMRRFSDWAGFLLLLFLTHTANLRERVPSPTVEIERTLRSESQDEKTLTVEEAMRLHPNWYRPLWFLD